jgi:hypothetical protein
MIDDAPLFLTYFNFENIPSTTDYHSLHLFIGVIQVGVIVYTYLLRSFKWISWVLFLRACQICFNLIQWTYHRCICGMYVCVYVGIIGDFGKISYLYGLWFYCKDQNGSYVYVYGSIMETKDFGN